MDGSQHDYRPRKKIRLEDTFESRNVSINSFQYDESSQGLHHNVYAQEPPKFKFEEARNTNSFVSTCEAEIQTHHRLTVEHQYGQCTELYHQGSETSGTIASCSPSALYTPAGTPLGYNSELLTKDYSDEVCFGMVGPRSVAQYSKKVLTML